MATVDSRTVAEKLIGEARERRKDARWVWGIPYGFETFDLMTGGIQPGSMDVFIGASNVGKSALVTKIARNVARLFRDDGSGRVVKYVTLEMLPSDLQRRMACLSAQVSMRRVLAGFLSDGQEARFREAQEEIAALPIQYVHGVESVADLERELRAGGRCGLWVLDHIGLLPGGDPSNPYSSISAVSGQVAKLCKRVAPGLIIGHQNLDDMKATDKRPKMTGVAGGQKMVRDADRLFGIYRDDLYTRVPGEEADEPKPGELILLKGRGCAAQGTVFLTFDPARTDWAEDDEMNEGLRARLLAG